ncbi:MAG: DUF6290 family protein [Christensenellaceae bacterium]|jgi:predicted DNA-binding protein|nr:DUF6290 family protein [Christensenellaceae bacterium]
MAVTVRFNENELNAVRAYAEIHGVTLSAVLRNAILEKIEDEFDLQIAQKAHDEWVADGRKTISHAELGKKLGLI